MTVNDWLSEIGSEIETVVRDDLVFTKGVRETVEGIKVSITVTEQSGYYQAYVVAEAEDASKNIEDAEQSVRVIEQVLTSQEEVSVATERNDRWAESCFRVDPDKVKIL